MFNQIITCIKCGKKLGYKDLICKYCKQSYSLLTVQYLNDDHPLSLDEMYIHYLPFNLFKKSDFKNCSLKKISRTIWLKNEGENESKSVKEKDIFTGLKVASYLGYKKATCVSGGSGINVIDFYSKKNLIPITLYSPESTSKHANNQILFGKDYEETFKLVLQSENKDVCNITPGINPYSQEGSKVIAWQIIESKIDFEGLIIPCGNGSTLWGIYKGFLEAKEQGFIERVPKIFGVELKNGPIGRSIKTGKIEKNYQIINSKAHSIDVKESFCLQKAIIATKQTNGSLINVSEKEIDSAYKFLHKKNYLSNYTAAASFAGARKLKKLKNICCILTASE